MTNVYAKPEEQIELWIRRVGRQNYRPVVKRLIEECPGVSFTKLAATIGIARGTLYNVLNGREHPSPFILIELLDLIGYDMVFAPKEPEEND